jgi:ATP-dependent helicase/nuclease subunit A
VQLRTPQGPQWWVLDYKLATRPQDSAVHQAQMRRYRRALQAMLPGQVVRAALVAGDGRVIEVGDAA